MLHVRPHRRTLVPADGRGLRMGELDRLKPGDLPNARYQALVGTSTGLQAGIAAVRLTA